jgi:hypothetical protein
MFSVSNSSFNVVAKASTIGGEGRPGYAGRKIVVEPGQIYVFLTGVMDQQGMHETYRGGEIIYVSDTADMKSRKFVALNERAAELTINGEREILGVTTASDKATITVRLSLTVKDPLRVATMYASGPDADNDLRVKIESSVLRYIENTLAIWSQPEHELVNIITARINTQVEGYGLALLHANCIVQRTMPRALGTIQAEARMADLRLLESIEALENGTAQDALREYDRKFIGKIFTPQRTEEWLAMAHTSGKATHGKAFLQLVVACVHMGVIDITDEEKAIVGTEDTLHSFLLEGFQAVSIAKYVKALRGDKLNVPAQDQIQDSVEILLNSFV